MSKQRKIILRGIIVIQVFVIVALFMSSMTRPFLDEDGNPPVDKTTESFGKAAGWFIERFGEPDWIGIHAGSEYRVSFLFKDASMYVLFQLYGDEWQWVGLWPYREPVDLEKKKQEIIKALEEEERKKKFKILDEKLNIITS